MTREDEPPRLLVTVVPYALLAFLTVFTVVNEEHLPLADLVLCAATAAWMYGMFTRRRDWWDRPVIMGVFFTGLLILTAILVIRHPAFGFFTPAPYIYAFAILPWPWRLPAAAGVAAVAGMAQASTVDSPAIYAIIVVVNVIIMVGLGWILRLEETERDELNRTNKLLATTLAENAGLHDQLLAQAREAGVLDERQRMAREIHDTLAQGLTGIITQLQAAEQRHDVPDEWRKPFDAIKKLARESLTEARRSVDALRPEPLETGRLSDALAEVATQWSKLHGTAVQVTTTGMARPMSPEAEFALLRTAQEALANVAKHAHARRVGVTLSYLDNSVALDVRDDGTGFSPAGVNGGFGLTIMRQRVEKLFGTLQIESEPGAGTGISACIPIGGTHD
ncbi:sensor histidine kinase [Kibdelosporangium philippinense]|uniref:Oxygen sensor histidine kinase NreB n=1 Tax=Kibdelosporangium philippinense TaxID=211113 RepID=A0ABS8ZA27_9PSEU|nr:sensor histidine kinase [Kibdelosporangium philippinense]MCE7004726.1 sensor histidine kinase [Kibdelosporangium philippinense]